MICSFLFFSLHRRNGASETPSFGAPGKAISGAILASLMPRQCQVPEGLDDHSPGNSKAAAL